MVHSQGRELTIIMMMVIISLVVTLIIHIHISTIIIRKFSRSPQPRCALIGRAAHCAAGLLRIRPIVAQP